LPVAFLILTIYSLLKRYTSACHLVLGVALGSSAIGGWLAVTGQWSWLAFILGLAVTFWVAGFDIIYACQDVEFDRENRLHSIPAWLGIEQALRLSKICHALTWMLLAVFGWLYPYTGYGYQTALLIIAGLLVYEHRLVQPQNLSKLDVAFFSVNGWISLLLFVSVLVDKVLTHSQVQ
jgi:4-hydroxybenzoate polyprenyltransferase